MNCCKEVNDGKTDWLRLRCKAALRRVESEILRDIPADPESPLLASAPGPSAEAPCKDRGCWGGGVAVVGEGKGRLLATWWWHLANPDPMARGRQKWMGRWKGGRPADPPWPWPWPCCMRSMLTSSSSSSSSSSNSDLTELFVSDEDERSTRQGEEVTWGQQRGQNN